MRKREQVILVVILAGLWVAVGAILWPVFRGRMSFTEFCAFLVPFGWVVTWAHMRGYKRRFDRRLSLRMLHR